MSDKITVGELVLVRLRPQEIDAIKNSLLEYIPEAKILVYGSRVDDTKKGGDIDLLVYCKSIPDLSIKNRILLNLYDLIGEQKIDILYSTSQAESNFTQLINGEAIEI